MKYFEISVSTNHVCSDSVAAVLWGLGCEGVATYDKQDYIDLIDEGKTWDYVEENLSEQDVNIVVVKGFFLNDDILSRAKTEITELKNYNESCGSLEVNGVWLDDAEYADEWKKYYKTIPIGAVAIVPSWLPPEDSMVNVLLDPGAAFGTGSHETTYMCVEVMQELDLAEKSVIDLGCGSGILGITALKLGTEKAVFVDVESMAIDVSRENAKLNGVESMSEFYCGDLIETDYRADVIFANITADILCKLSPCLSGHLSNGGKVLLSGVIDRERERVLNIYEGIGYRVLKHVRRGDWHSFLIEAPK